MIILKVVFLCFFFVFYAANANARSAQFSEIGDWVRVDNLSGYPADLIQSIVSQSLIVENVHPCKGGINKNPHTSIGYIFKPLFTDSIVTNVETTKARLTRRKGSISAYQFDAKWTLLSGSKHEPSRAISVEQRRLPSICKIDLEPNKSLKEREISAIHGEIPTNLSFANTSRFFGGNLGDGQLLLSGVKGFPNEENADKGGSYFKNADAKHTSGPKGHILLGLQILIGSLLVGVGIQAIAYATRERSPLSIAAGLSYFVLGFFAVALGVVLISGIDLLYFGVLP